MNHVEGKQFGLADQQGARDGGHNTDAVAALAVGCGCATVRESRQCSKSLGQNLRETACA